MFMNDNNATPISSIPRPMLFVAAALLLLLLAASAWWLLQSKNSVLFRDLDASSTAEVIAALQEMGVPYEFAEKGSALLVPESKVLATRMELVSRGIPHNGSVGFELFSDADYGMTDFAQKVNFQRALQGELERTITSLSEVRAARVHLTLPRSSAFFRERGAPKASVTVTTVNEAPLDAVRIAGIQHLVAAAVEGMDADTVVVLNHQGTPLSGADAATAGIGAASQLDKKRRIESDLKNKLVALLGSSFNAGTFSVSVSATLNFDRVTQTREQVLSQDNGGEGAVLRRKENRLGPADTAKNSVTPAANTSEEVEYALGKSVEEIVYASGRIEKLTVGVLIDGDLTNDEQTRLKDLISAAAGLDAARGDRVVITSFDKPGIEAPENTFVAPTPLPVTNVTSASALDAGVVERVPPFSIRHMLVVGTLLLALLLFLLVFIARRARKNEARRMNAQERESAMMEIRAWLDESPAEAARS